MFNKIYYYLSYKFPPSGSIILRFFGLQNYEAVLDIGCGKLSVLRVFDNKYKTGIDAFEDYISISKNLKIHHDYIHENVTELDLEKVLPEYHAVLAFDLIEHLTEEEAVKLIQTLEDCPNIKFIAIKTPSSYVDQDTYDGNMYQKHKSSLSSEFFRKRSYQILGVDGPKFLYLDGTTMRKDTSILRSVLSILLRPIFTFFPDRSLNYMAVLKR